MRVDPEYTCNADPTISPVWWDVLLILLVRVGLGLYLRWNFVLVLGTRYRASIIILVRLDHIDGGIISHAEDL